MGPEQSSEGRNYCRTFRTEGTALRSFSFVELYEFCPNLDPTFKSPSSDLGLCKIVINFLQEIYAQIFMLKNLLQ
jgi:hypothetical protein